MSRTYVDSDELLDIHREMTRSNDKFALRLERLEDTLSSQLGQGKVYPPGTFARRGDHEKLAEIVDELLAFTKHLYSIVSEVCLAMDITIDDFPVPPRSVRNAK